MSFCPRSSSSTNASLSGEGHCDKNSVNSDLVG